VGKPERKRPPERLRRRWEDGIRTDLREIGCGNAELIQLPPNRDQWRSLVNTVIIFICIDYFYILRFGSIR
jgi:hypothetical protein